MTQHRPNTDPSTDPNADAITDPITDPNTETYTETGTMAAMATVWLATQQTAPWPSLDAVSIAAAAATSKVPSTTASARNVVVRLSLTYTRRPETVHSHPTRVSRLSSSLCFRGASHNQCLTV